MRHVLLLSVLMLGVTWAAAQTPGQSPSTDSSPSSAGQTAGQASSSHTTVEGCLSGADGKYTLTDKSGTAYQLTGDTSKLAEHVGHEIKVTGSAGAGAGSAASAGSAAGGQSLDVSSVKMVSKTCKADSGMAK
jgi:hypothetical protein